MQHLPGETLRKLVHCPGSGIGRLESVIGRDFSELFRDWGLQLMATHRGCPRHDLANESEAEFQLAGTAFTWTAATRRHGVLEIHAARESDLQLTLVTDCEATSSSP